MYKEELSPAIDYHNNTQVIMTGLFQHAPLDHTKSSIRLLRILPDLSATGLIQCEIWHDESSAEYTCLSYTWGPDYPQKFILLNGKPHSCRENLGNFLGVARKKYSGAASSFWKKLSGFPQRKKHCHDVPAFRIDAICINQSSVTERNHQVSRMGEIYSNASAVLVWLGHDQNIERLFKYVTSLDICNLPPYTWWKPKHEFRFEPWYAFRANNYWTQAWITQEILLARSVRFLVSKSEIGTAECLFFQQIGLQKTANQFEYWNYPRNDHDAQEQRFATYVNATARTHQPRETKIHSRGTSLSVLQELYGRKCSHPRDQVYSLLSIVEDGHSITVDYGNSDEEFFVSYFSSLKSPLRCICSLFFLTSTFSYWSPVPIAFDINVGYKLPRTISIPSSLVVCMDVWRSELSTLEKLMNPYQVHCQHCSESMWLSRENLDWKHLFCLNHICDSYMTSFWHLLAWRHEDGTLRIRILKWSSDQPRPDFTSAQGVRFHKSGKSSFTLYLPLRVLFLLLEHDGLPKRVCRSESSDTHNDDPQIKLNIEANTGVDEIDFPISSGSYTMNFHGQFTR
jgi:hypothetical protein